MMITLKNDNIKKGKMNNDDYIIIIIKKMMIIIMKIITLGLIAFISKNGYEIKTFMVCDCACRL